MKALTILCILVALVLTSCVSRTRSDVSGLRDDIASGASSARVRADKVVVVVDERLAARANLLHIAIAAVAVVSLALVAGSYFPEIAIVSHAVAAAAGTFAAMVLALRSVLSVPEWVVLLVLGVAGLIVVLRVAFHSAGLSHAMRQLAQTGQADLTQLSGKARSLVVRLRAWAEHHHHRP